MDAATLHYFGVVHEVVPRLKFDEAALTVDRLTFSPGILPTDGEALLLAGTAGLSR